MSGTCLMKPAAIVLGLACAGWMPARADDKAHGALGSLMRLAGSDSVESAVAPAVGEYAPVPVAARAQVQGACTPDNRNACEALLEQVAAVVNRIRKLHRYHCSRLSIFGCSYGVSVYAADDVDWRIKSTLNSVRNPVMTGQTNELYLARSYVRHDIKRAEWIPNHQRVRGPADFYHDRSLNNILADAVQLMDRAIALHDQAMDGARH